VHQTSNPDRGRTARLAPWALFGVSAALGFTGLGLQAAGESIVTWHFASNDLIAIVIFFVSGFVGALVASRLPENPIGWIFTGFVVLLGASSVAGGYAALSIHHGPPGGLAPWAAAYHSDVFVVFLGVLLFTLLLFPDGRLRGRRWRAPVWAGSIALVLITTGVLFDDAKLNDYPELRNPMAIHSPVFGWLFVPGFVLFIASLVAAAASIVVRFRRARGVERQQLTVLMASGTVAALGFVVSASIQSIVSQDLGNAITLFSILAVPVGIGVAMLRYRLYEIDRVISRTLVYAALTVILGAAYTGLVLAGQAVFSSFAGGSNLAIAGSTLVVAALFLPLRARVQRLVDRRFYRRRYDAQRTLETFGARLRQEIELETLTDDLRHVIGETMQPAHLSVWLREAR
jgi:N-terminal 7TM region of histidine kinase